MKNFLFNLSYKNYPKALIFHGPSGSGKTTSVRLFAHKLWFPDENDRDIAENPPPLSSLFDYEEISGVENSGVNDMRELKERASLSSMSGKPRIFVIDEAHGLSSKAFDALLKVTEESKFNVFIFVTTEFDKIPKTIKTRAIDFQFNEPDVHEIKNFTKVIFEREGYEVSDELAGVIAFKSDNSYRSSLTLVEKIIPLLSKDKKNDVETVPNSSGLLKEEEINAIREAPKYLRKKDFIGLIGLVEGFKNDERELRNFCFYLYNYSRKIAKSEKDRQTLIFLSELGTLLQDPRLPVNKIAVEVVLYKTINRIGA